MNKLNLLVLLVSVFSNVSILFAADLVVQQGGPVGTYSTITSAITAATDGDNIVINNRLDGLPWQENLTINKSLTFVSAVDNIQWWMEGTISITMAESRQITIVGMRNTLVAGTISRSGTAPVNRTLVNILFCDIASDISMGSGINLYLGSTKVRDVSFTYGKIYGNDVRSITLNPDGVVTEDVVQIIGNRTGFSWSPVTTGINCVSNTQYIFLSNNYSRGSGWGIYVGSLKAGSVTNRIINSASSSSFSGTAANNFSAISLFHTSGNLAIENSVFAGTYTNATNGSHSIYGNATAISLTTFTYNMHMNYFSGGHVPSTSLGNFQSSFAVATNFNSDGSLASGSGHVNAGNPMNTHLDLDLSRNDIGVMGGSYSMANFWPLVFNGESSRVNFMNTPRVVPQGGTVNVQAIGYDK
jgi:hypothetical protein